MVGSEWLYLKSYMKLSATGGTGVLSISTWLSTIFAFKSATSVTKGAASRTAVGAILHEARWSEEW